jgi:hypothetical protein
MFFFFNLNQTAMTWGKKPNNVESTARATHQPSLNKPAIGVTKHFAVLLMSDLDVQLTHHW